MQNILENNNDKIISINADTIKHLPGLIIDETDFIVKKKYSIIYIYDRLRYAGISNNVFKNKMWNKRKDITEEDLRSKLRIHRLNML